MGSNFFGKIYDKDYLAQGVGLHDPNAGGKWAPANNTQATWGNQASLAGANAGYGTMGLTPAQLQQAQSASTSNDPNGYLGAMVKAGGGTTVNPGTGKMAVNPYG